MKKSFLVLFILASGLLLKAQEKGEKQAITLEDLWKTYSYYPESVNGLQSMNDGLHYTILEGDTAIGKYSYKTGDRVSEIVNTKQLKNDKIKGLRNYQFSADESKIIFFINSTAIYRRSFTAEYFVWDIANQKLYPVSDKGTQRLATLSPDGKKVAFMRDNNLFISTLESGAETEVTTDGKWNEIINGAPDWVYEEEFEYNQAFDWSPDGKYLAYCKFDESKVPQFNMTMFEGQFPRYKANKLYPENYAYKYPKAGDDNSVVTVYSYNVESGKTLLVDTGKETNQYIPRLKWHPANKMVIYRMNRLQNKLEMLYGNPETGETKVFYTEENKCYIDEKYFDYLTFINEGKQFIYTSERDGYLHIYLHNEDGTIVNQVTKGQWDVTDYLGYNDKTKEIYYQSAEASPMNRDIFKIKTNGTKKTEMSHQSGTNNAVFSAGYKYYINYFSNSSTPTYVTLHDEKGKQLRVLEDNKELKEKLAQTTFSPKEFFTFTTEDNVILNGWMIKPVDFNPGQKYPVLMTQYSGPNSQEVLDNFEMGWEQVLAANGYLVICVDGRGTGARGEEFRKVTYLQLGKYEVQDQISTAKYLGTLSYVDAERIGIFGWSFGGFMALNCITQGAPFFKAAIAVAPVTNWRYYDNIYTERFMRTPAENTDGYDQNSPITHASKLTGKLLLVHGTADDNVHVQNSMEMSEALVQANKQFEQFYYTNRNHGIYGGNTRYHLYTKMVNFLKSNL